MKSKLAALVAGIIFGTAGTAVASGIYWKRGGNDYRCEGIDTGVVCNSGGYKVGFTDEYAFVKRGSKVFGCEKYLSWANCIEG